MVWNKLFALYKDFACRPWQSWGGCTQPELTRYAMDYAFGWLMDPAAVPELADKAHDLHVAFVAHLKDCLECQETVRFWQAVSEPREARSNEARSNVELTKP